MKSYVIQGKRKPNIRHFFFNEEFENFRNFFFFFFRTFGEKYYTHRDEFAFVFVRVIKLRLETETRVDIDWYKQTDRQRDR